MVFFLNFGGILEFIYFKKYHIFYLIYAYFVVKYVLNVNFFLTTLQYHSNKFLELKSKDEVTLLSPAVLFWY